MGGLTPVRSGREAPRADLDATRQRGRGRALPADPTVRGGAGAEFTPGRVHREPRLRGVGPRHSGHGSAGRLLGPEQDVPADKHEA